MRTIGEILEGLFDDIDIDKMSELSIAFSNLVQDHNWYGRYSFIATQEIVDATRKLYRDSKKDVKRLVKNNWYIYFDYHMYNCYIFQYEGEESKAIVVNWMQDGSKPRHIYLCLTEPKKEFLGAKEELRKIPKKYWADLKEIYEKYWGQYL